MKIAPYTIHRSILKELLVAFALGLLTFNFILVTEKLLHLTKMFASVGASLPDMIKILILFQPQITVLTTPIAFLMAVLLTYGRMGADNELVVLRASGMSFASISRPAFIFGAGCFALTLVASFWAAPVGARNLGDTVSDIIAKRAPLAIEEGIFNTSFRDVVIYVDKKTGEGKLKDVFIYDGRRSREPVVLTAREAMLSTPGRMNISFDLKNGRIHIVHGDGSTELSFGRYVLSFPLEAAERQFKSRNELTPPQLISAASSASGEQKTKLILELHRRLSLPSLCLILMVLGPPLSLMAGRSGKLGGLAIGMLVFALYYTAVVYTEGLAMGGTLPIWVGAWAPSAAFAAISVWMFRRASSQ